MQYSLSMYGVSGKRLIISDETYSSSKKLKIFVQGEDGKKTIIGDVNRDEFKGVGKAL